jgi:zinc protease
MGFLLPALDEEKLQNQKDVVMNERRQRVDNQPYGRAFETLHELLYPQGHPYRWPVIGYMDDIAASTLAEVQEFFNNYYRPNNAVLTLVGDFQPARAFELVKRYFGGIPTGSVPPKRSATPELASRRHAVRHELRDAVNLPRLYMAWRGPALADHEWPAGDLYSVAATGGKSSPLYRDLVLEREIAQDIYVGMVPLELESTFLVAMTLRPGIDPARAETALVTKLEGWRSVPPDAADFERAQNRTRIGHLHEVESFESRADLLSLFATHHGDAAAIDSEAARYAAVTPSEALEFAQRYQNPDHAVILWVLPEEST